MLLTLVAGAIFIVVAAVVTVRRLLQSQPRTYARKAMWSNLLQLVVVAIFLVLAALETHNTNAFVRWAPRVTVLLTALNVVVALATTERRARPSA
ncbi:hypothetical protein MRAB57_4073 [Mycobacterium rhizamassiliense]|uniref:Uncharacterized protein n=1 Tax=Mycobacterium rhizamassiliense TaxID=1841860 RepID=A0A2U3NXN5_9MYCO|nr:hypothetical protein [Mycobacterium rhizamassiliense]SPM36233.1 hypothetical protein MRAB57_4073 [Mycobacterium rhizamassiliense]